MDTIVSQIHTGHIFITYFSQIHLSISLLSYRFPSGFSLPRCTSYMKGAD